MTNRIQTLRSASTGTRPGVGTRQPGELYVNFADKQIGVIDPTQTPQDLQPIPFFSATANYAAGAYMVQSNQLYQAIAAVPPGAFNATQWRPAFVQDAPSDGTTYGRVNATWKGVLPLTGGTLTGSVGVGVTAPTAPAPNAPSLLAQGSMSVASPNNGGFGINAYRATSGWSYWASDFAAIMWQQNTDGSVVISPFAKGTAGAAIGPNVGVNISQQGCVALVQASPVPSDCNVAMFSGARYTCNVSGYYGWNIYTTAAGIKALTSNYAGYQYLDNSGNWFLNLFGNTTGGAVLGAVTSSISLNQAGLFSVSGGIHCNNGRIQAISAGGNPCVSCWDTTAGYAAGISLDANKNFIFGGCGGNGAPSSTFAWFSTDQNFHLSQSVYAAGAFYCSGTTDFGYYVTGNQRCFNFANGGWCLIWDVPSGNFTFQKPGGVWTMHRNSDGLFFNNIIGVGGYGAYQNFSDRRMKQDITATDVGLPEILKLNPVTFTRLPRNPDTPQAPRSEMGFVAQEVQAVLPHAVSVVGVELEDGTGGLASDEPTLAIMLDPIVAALVNAVKTLNTRLETLETAA